MRIAFPLNELRYLHSIAKLRFAPGYGKKLLNGSLCLQ